MIPKTPAHAQKQSLSPRYWRNGTQPNRARVKEKVRNVRFHGRYCDMNVPQFANGVLGKLGIYSLTSQILPSVLATAVE